MVLHETALQYLGLVFLGFGIGAYGTLIGAGGGFLLMPVLLFIYPKEHQQTLTAISLAVVFFNSISGAAAYARLKRIDYKSGMMLAAATIPGAIFGVITNASIPRRVFEAIFSVFLISLALFLLLRPKSDAQPAVEKPPSPPRGLTRIFQSMDGVTFEYHYYLWLVPVLAYLLNFPVFIATGTSQFIVVITTFAATLVHIFHGSFHHGAHRIAALGIGVLIGAQFGAYLSKKISGAWIIRALAVAVALVGIKMLIAVF
ncbi:MAG: sulfite exporter TauE/SafE family protein [Syntrophobacterales bacterium]